VFTRRTVAGLAPVAVAPRAERRTVTVPAVGELPLTPLLRWLDECGGPVTAFSQSMLVHTPAGLTSERLHDVLLAVVSRHDLLRARLVRAGSGGPGRLVVPPVEETPDPARWLTRVAGHADVAAEAEYAAHRLDPEHGVMVQAVWFDHGAFAPGRLLLAVHHAVMDGVSWRILLHDLAAAWAGEAPLPPTTSFRLWALARAAEARRPGRVAELPLWTSVLAGPDPLVGARALDPVADRDAVRRLTLELPEADTEPLLTSLPAAFGAHVNDGLLAGLALAVAAWRGSAAPVLVALEGHGREADAVGSTIDLSRTVGWFTSIFPVRLDVGPVDVGAAVAGGPDAGRALKRVKEQLRALPDRGVGYGLLRYLNPRTAEVLAALPAPQISFNYLGRFTASEQPWTAVADAGVLAGGYDEAMPVAPYALEINALALDGPAGPRLRVTWAWPGTLLAGDAVRSLAEGWFAALRGLVRHAAGPGAGGATPSDLTLTGLSQDELDEFEAAWEPS
jgi:non-ribosomal peptide synthase protein (TIGR01720 family)